MADTTFVDGVIAQANRIVAAWLNAVGNYVYRGSRPTFGTTTGAANIYVLTLPATSLYIAAAEGDTFTFKAHQSNTAAATFSVIGGATITAVAIQVNGAALTGNEIQSGGVYSLTRVGAVWQLSDQIQLPVPVSLGGTGSITAIAARLALGFSAIAAKGDLFIGSAANTIGTKTIGTAGTVPMARTADTLGIAYVAALNKVIYGLTYANNAGDATNDLDIAAGGAMDATGAYWMTLSAITKQSDVAWAVGTGNGGLDTGAVGNSDYYIWLIARSDTGVVDVLYSLSSTAPTMPGAGAYDFKRLIGWFKRVGGTVVAFHTYETEGGGLELNWDVPTADVSLAGTLTTVRRTDAVKVPLNFSVTAHLNATITDASASAVIWICCPDQTDAAPAELSAPGTNLNTVTSKSGDAQMFIRTSATGTVAARADLATVDNYRLVTIGFRWARRN